MLGPKKPLAKRKKSTSNDKNNKINAKKTNVRPKISNNKTTKTIKNKSKTPKRNITITSLKEEKHNFETDLSNEEKFEYKEESIEDESLLDNKLIVGIDFGTDGTALAFSIPNSNQVYIKQDWNEKNKYNNKNFGVKMKTNILLNRISKVYNDNNIINDYKNNDLYDYKIVAFGDEAKNKYQNKHIYKNESRNWIYFEKFKMALFKGSTTQTEKVNISEYLISKNGTKVKSQIVFIESFKYIIRQVKSWISKHNKIIKLSQNNIRNIEWIISVPAIWSNESKNLMLQWFNAAGISMNNMSLKCEANCAAVSVQHELRQTNSPLKCGNKYVLLDLGGGTVDIVCYELDDSFKNKEICNSTGGAWGSNYIDIEFEKLIMKIFGKNNINEFIRLHECEYLKLLDNFINSCKLKFFHSNFRNKKLVKKPKKSSMHNIELPAKFVEYFEKKFCHFYKSPTDLEEYFEDYKYNNKSGLIELNDKYLSINYTIWYEIFNVCIIKIIKHLHHLLHNNKLNNSISHMILVGGFSQSKYLQYRICNEFGTKSKYKLNVIIPVRPLLCVVDGSVRLGLNNYNEIHKSEYSIKKSSSFELIVAIDFGTDGTALAFALPKDNEVYIRQDWNEKNSHHKENFGVKMKTHILLDKRNNEYKFIAFGGEARDMYQNKLIYEEESKNWLYFESFKMALFEGKTTTKDKISINEYLVAKNGIKVKSDVIFVESFKYLIRQVKLYVENRSDIIKLSNGVDSIQWIVSVPAIWSDKSKNLMMKWLKLAGIRNNIKLQYEPDCASISVQNELKQQSNSLSSGERYMLLDLGGGTADIACHELLADLSVREIYHPTGGAWGSTYIDKEFEKFLNNIFTTEVINKFKRLHEGEYMTLIDNFIQHCKVNFFYKNFQDQRLKKKPKKKSKHNTELPLKFVEFLENEESLMKECEDLEEFFENCKYKNKEKLMELNGSYLALNYIIWYDLFDVCVNQIINHILDLLDKKVKNISYLILVGGFSDSKYIQYKLFSTFGINSKYKLKMIIPTRPILSVVDGACRIGLNPNYMNERKLSKTYGTEFSCKINTAKKNNIPIKYINKNKYIDWKGETLVRNCFRIFAGVHKNVKKDEKITLAFGKHTNSDYNQNLYCSDLENPYSITQGIKIGFVLVPKTIPQGGTYFMDFYFGDTVITVCIRQPNNDKIIRTTINYQI